MHPCSAVTSKIKKDLKRTNIRPTSKNVAFESGAGQQHCIDKDMKRAAALSLVEGGGLKTHIHDGIPEKTEKTDSEGNISNYFNMCF